MHINNNKTCTFKGLYMHYIISKKISLGKILEKIKR